jgi:hypothetical protein
MYAKYTLHVHMYAMERSQAACTCVFWTCATLSAVTRGSRVEGWGNLLLTENTNM